MRYFVGTELGVANLLQRHFDWVSNSLWFEEIPNGRDPSKTLFLLGGRDDIIHAEVSILRIALFPLLKIYLAARKTLPHFARGPGKLTLWSQW